MVTTRSMAEKDQGWKVEMPETLELDAPNPADVKAWLVAFESKLIANGKKLADCDGADSRYTAAFLGACGVKSVRRLQALDEEI